MKLPFANGFYRSDTLPLSAQEAINCFPEPVEIEGISDAVVLGIPGITQELTTGSTNADANRGGHVMNSVPYVVNGSSLYKINSDSISTSLGTIDGFDRVVMADNGTQLMIVVPGLKGYIYTEAGGLVEVTDSDYSVNGFPIYVTFVDGYFVCVTNEKRFTCSNINDGTAWTGTDVGTAESDPDELTACVVLNNQLYLIGTETIEQFANRPRGADFPFQRTGNFADYGTRSPYSVVKTSGQIFFVGSSVDEPVGVFVYSGTGQPQKVSTRPIDTLLQALTADQIADIVAWSYSQGGHNFIGFALGNTAIVFDLTTGLWHERKSTLSLSDGLRTQTRYRVSCVLPAYGKLLVGDLIDGRVGSLSTNVYSEYGENIIRRVVGQPFLAQLVSFTVPMLEATIESGVGNSDVTDPQLRMERSLDGKNWTDPRQASMGKAGEYQKRQIWYKLGRGARFEYFAFETSEKCKFALIRVDAKVIPGLK
jgi:hypothetical protein